jgi:hypothetical protein
MLLERKKQMAALVTLAFFGCGDPPTSTQKPAAPRSLMKQESIGSVVTDRVMGNLSLTAHQIAVGLGNAKVRQLVVQAMKSPAAAGAGLDLNACETGTIVGDLLTAAEQRGAGSAAALCSSIRRSGGRTLYMSKDGLRQWDGSFVPIVTAIESPHLPLPKRWKGYRSGQRTIDLFADKSPPGPVLVVSPIIHPAAVARAARTIPTQQVQVGPLAPVIRPRATTSAAQERGVK